MIQLNKVDKWLKTAINFIFVLFFGFVALQTFGVSHHILTDAAYYLMGAENLAKGNGFSSYNVGYLANTEISDFKTLIPITRYQPLYSFVISLFIKNFHLSSLLSARIVNLIFYAVFLFSWLSLYRKMFYNPFLFAFAAFFLLFPIGIFSYILPPHTEMLFLALLGILGNLVYYWSIAENKLKKIGFTVLLAVVSVLILLTRYAGMGFILGLFISLFFVFQRFSFSNRIFNILLFVTILVFGFSFWAFRNIEIIGTITSRYPDSYHGTIFDFERIFEIINLFFNFSLGLPSALENFLFLLLIPLLFILGLIFYYRIFRNNSLNIWLLFSLLVYVSMVVYMGIGNRAVSRINGFMRFFALTQPFLIAILLNMFMDLSKIKRNSIFLVSKIFIIGLLSISLLSGVNRTRIFFKTLPKTEQNADFYASIKKRASENDLILSNDWQNVSAKTALPIVQIHYKTDIDSLKQKYRGKYNKIFLVLDKNVGKTYRKGVDTWDFILKDVDFYKIKENKKSIFVQLKYL